MSKGNYDLPNETLQEIMKFSGAKSKRAAILIAMEAYLKRKRIERLIQYFGKIQLNWKKKGLIND